MRFNKLLSISIRLIIVSIVIFSLAYPFLLGGIGQLWSNNVQGSLIKYEGKPVGSRIIGQEFSDSRYFHSRPSSIGYDASRSGSANLAPGNPELRRRVEASLKKLDVQKNVKVNEIPADFMTESGSALDPHLSPEAALLQVPRIAAVTGISEDELKSIVKKNIKPKLLGIFGMKRVNVLKLNLAVEEVLSNE